MTTPDHPITARWPAQHPERLQLYSFPTPNGVKVSIMLEETGLPYEVHRVSLLDNETRSDAFLALNPNGKIPAIIDPDGPDGEPLALFESGAILLYLAEKTGMFLGETAHERAAVTQWLMFQMGGVGPMFGQMGYFFKFAGSEIEDPRPRERYLTETARLLRVVENRLADREWIAGPYSIADIALGPWINALEFYGVKEAIGWDSFPGVQAYLKRFLDRPAVQSGLVVPPREG
ncbi:glutathione S-transferase family protein [Sagittula salina]|uniref:Glutathione S-transferase N-terminal domain-containing protein n=1 Tax=Sagittula salina TaxID=2820268 RepID=A0A940S299_9RHOB|nr:glutathione S-transferase N-terminal domain-containing protein [Sagittula salina]MBP0481430.1 glutathione S-transferase N-terminal domain-containing protein [Sagittula salina]